MGHVFLLMPLVIFANPREGGLPRVRDVNSHQQTTSSHHTSLFPCVPAHRRVHARTAPAPALGENFPCADDFARE